jgi:hypothetical protein
MGGEVMDLGTGEGVEVDRRMGDGRRRRESESQASRMWPGVEKPRMSAFADRPGKVKNWGVALGERMMDSVTSGRPEAELVFLIKTI